MQRPRLILHIGSQKTGTTSIQGFLKSQTNALEGEGLSYVKAGRTNIAHNSVLQSIKKDGGADVALSMLYEIEKRPDLTHVISSEMFFRAGLATWFETHFPEDLRAQTKVLAYIRRQDGYAEAMYKQRVKNGRYSGAPEDYATQVVNLDYGSVINSFARVFGAENMALRPFERRHFPKGDVLADFCAIAGLSDNILTNYDHPSSNATLSREVSELLGDMKRAGTDHNTRDIIRKLIAIRPEGAIRSGDCLPLALRRQIMSQHAASNEALRARYLPEIDTLFDLSDLEQTARYSQPTPRQLKLRKAEAKAAIDQAIRAISA